MGLDKWLKAEDKVKKNFKEEQNSIKIKEIDKGDFQKKIAKKRKVKLKKYTLICPNVKCKYQKIIMKKQLTNIDKKCPRCNREMKIK